MEITATKLILRRVMIIKTMKIIVMIIQWREFIGCLVMIK